MQYSKVFVSDTFSFKISLILYGDIQSVYESMYAYKLFLIL